MVRISGTLSNSVSMSAGTYAQGDQNNPRQIKEVQKPDRPTAIGVQRPDMTFSGIGRTLDINV
ncbi:hypothetical protein [Sneathiella glossodoripedis]|uniref:hypothetical protein n=1 Tax=Sneathiella glossodoripedis TaxID=418853 RepID=UPI000471D41A|nr:hypothetical protein [Sneathiella glossodoripedis]